MAVKSNLPLNGPRNTGHQNSGESRLDTVSAKPIRIQREGTKARLKNKSQRLDTAKLFDGLQTLYG